MLETYVLGGGIDSLTYPRTLEQVGGMPTRPELVLLASTTVSLALRTAVRCSTV